jgi:ribose 5-phosphate isomerase B
MRIATGSDHAGFTLKQDLIAWLQGQGHEVVDLGTTVKERCDYPDYAVAVADTVVKGNADWGLLICGTGIGMSMSANKVHGIRAAVVSDAFSARATRLHNDANVLCMGERVVGAGLAQEIVSAWLDADYEGGRHQHRIDKMMDIEN